MVSAVHFAEQDARANDHSWHFGSKAASGASCGRGSSLTFGKNMRLLISVLALSALAVAGCEKSPRAEKIVRAGLSADMSDEQLLRAMKRDPKKMKAEEARGPDGTSFVYADDEEEISITRSTFSGVVVLRRIKHTGVWQTWELGKP